MKIFTKIFLLVFVSILSLYAQSVNLTYSGPVSGSMGSGVLVSTTTFPKMAMVKEPSSFQVHNIIPTKELQTTLNGVEVKGTIDVDGNTSRLEKPNVGGGGILTTSFDGPKIINSIPPDPYISVGPTHMIAVVNSLFIIYDKQGNLVKSIDAGNWYNSILPGNNPFDPKVTYDHFAKRWVMVWLNSDSRDSVSHFLISVSDDSIPTGNWYNFASRSDYEGNTFVENWSDYQGVGFDEQAYYLTGNQFGYDNKYKYNKVRIINKAQLYANTGASVEYKDLYAIRSNFASTYFTMRPTIPYSSSSNYYFVQSNNSYNMDYVTVFTLTNPLTTPVMTAINVPVSRFSYPPLAGQLGMEADTSSIQLETGGSALKNEPTVVDDLIFLTHTVANSVDNKYSSIKYVCINASSGVAIEDVEYGSVGYWYSYPAIAVDKDLNVAVTFSRSGEDQYVGAYFASRLVNDAPGLSDSKVLQHGKGYYKVDYSTGRNRWGDYNGIWTDPVDRSSFWAFTEYAPASNVWGTYAGNIRLVPFGGTHFLTSKKVDFGNVEINKVSEYKEMYIVNSGDQILTFNNIPESVGPFKISLSNPLPISIAPFDTLKINVAFAPVNAVSYDTSLVLTTTSNIAISLFMKAKAFVINKAEVLKVYASTGLANLGNLATINLATGLGTNIGPSSFNDLKSIAVSPISGELIGLVTTTDGGNLVRINAELGDAYFLHKIGIKDIFSLAFDKNGVLFAATKQGKFYNINIENGDTTFLASAGTPVSSFAFHPTTNEVYASNFVVLGERDRIYKIDPFNGASLLLGRTGLNALVGAVVFDQNGNLFGASGANSALNDLISINTTTGAGTKIASTNLKHINGLTILYTNPSSTEGEEVTSTIPSQFSLTQNYPNPFNPSTLIEYSLPVEARVVLNVYNLLGENVATLVNQVEKAGTHRVQFDARNLSSGIYFYEINAEAFNNSFSEMKKMILVK